MADIVFDCPSCKQPVQADDAWAGQQINCPLCQAPMIVPQAQAPSTTGHLDAKSLGKQLVEVPGQTKLSVGGAQKPRSTGTGAVIREFQQPVKKQNPAIKYAIIGGVVVVLAVGGWFGWPYLKPHLPFLNKSGEEAPVAQAANPGKGTDPAAPVAEPATPPPPKEVPMTPPTYTLDIASAKISEGKVNGSITGTNFVPDVVRLDKLAGQYVLDLRQGAGATPDRGLRVYLNLGPTDSPTGHTWTVSQEMKGTPVSRVVKLWKTNPKYAAQEKAFTTGFALKLEFGQLTESNTIPGKIYAALPDKEQTVVGGVFTAVSTLGGVPGAVAAPTAAPASPAVNMSPEMQRRYGPGTRR
jgi:hypothetical protein